MKLCYTLEIDSLPISEAMPWWYVLPLLQQSQRTFPPTKEYLPNNKNPLFLSGGFGA